MDWKLFIILLIISLIVLLGCRGQSDDFKNSSLYKDMQRVRKQVQDSIANDPNAWQHRTKPDINTNDPKNYTWETTDTTWNDNFENDLVRITQVYGADHHGASFYVLRVLDKKRNIDRYFTDTWYLRLRNESIVDSSYSNVIIYDYLEGKFCYNLESELISRCFSEAKDTVFNELLTESVTTISGDTYFLSNNKVKVDNRKYLKSVYNVRSNKGRTEQFLWYAPKDTILNTTERRHFFVSALERYLDYNKAHYKEVNSMMIQEYLEDEDAQWLYHYFTTIETAVLTQEISQYLKRDEFSNEIRIGLINRDPEVYTDFSEYVRQTIASGRNDSYDLVRFISLPESNPDNSGIELYFTDNIFKLFDIEQLMADNKVSWES